MSDDLVKRLRDERDKARIAAANYAEFNHEWRRRAEALTAERDELKAELAKAVGALGEAIYLLDPDEEDIAKETGLHRIVTTYAELTGGKP